MISTGVLWLVIALTLCIGVSVGAAAGAWIAGGLAEEREGLLENELGWWRDQHAALSQRLIRMRQEGYEPAASTAAAREGSGRRR